MSTKEQRRQKKLGKKRSKELSEKKSRARQKNSLQSVAGQMKAASDGAIDRCLVSQNLLDPQQRFGSVWISRFMSDGRVGCGRFLVDGMCLGVKQAVGFVCFPAQLSEMIEKCNQVEELRSVAPATARKLVEGSIEYAQQFDLQPCAEYQKVRVIWGDIDPQQSATEFQFGGDDGKPRFIMGPNDTMATAHKILSKLESSAGEGNFDIDYEVVFDAENAQQADWTSDPELDVDIDDDVIDSTARQQARFVIKDASGADD